MAFRKTFSKKLKTEFPCRMWLVARSELAAAGANVGLSPFKPERTPSFTVNDDKQFYHCFSTGKHGSVFDF